MNGNNTWVKVAVGAMGFIQAFVLAGVLYWAGRVDANTVAMNENARDIGKIEGSLNEISKQLDRIEEHLDSDHKAGVK